MVGNSTPGEIDMDKKKILWVDDDKDFVESVQLQLEKEGWQVEVVFSPEEARSTVMSCKPDLVIMDIIMEGEHGYSVIEGFLKNDELAAVPIIVFSSLRQRWGQTGATRHDAIASEAAEFVDKSDGTAALIEILHKYLDKGA
jgi:CheY-like chemotaxis protein